MYKNIAGKIAKLLTDFWTSSLERGMSSIIFISNKIRVREMVGRDLTAKANRLICITNLELIKDKLRSELKVVVWVREPYETTPWVSA